MLQQAKFPSFKGSVMTYPDWEVLGGWKSRKAGHCFSG